ncbi:hypothetical protein V3W47_16035 [Deinococcus sp. YIM 134068]|uniref:hypothetical protein n=1 Tax=Deinococcus lichenicola TaxID=3118910 RepID=UPI002F957B67
MKRLLLLPSLLLAACAPAAAPVGPLVPGDVLTLTGTTKSKEAVNVTLTVRNKGERDGDGDWEYDADSTQPDSAFIILNGEQDFVGVVEGGGVLGTDGQEDDRVLLCLGETTGPGWRTATGYLVQESVTDLTTLLGRAQSQSGLSGLKTLAESSGDCTITRK